MPKEFKTNSCRPTGRMTAYGFYQKEYLKVYGKKLEENWRAVAKCMQTWKQLTCDDKKKWRNMAANDRRRYSREMKEWEESNPLVGDAKRHKKLPPKKARKDPCAPAHPFSAYMWWAIDNRPAEVRKHPGEGVCAISKRLGKKWKKVNNEVRLRYELLADRDKVRYRREMKKYLERKRQSKSIKKRK